MSGSIQLRPSRDELAADPQRAKTCSVIGGAGGAAGSVSANLTREVERLPILLEAPLESTHPLRPRVILTRERKGGV